MFLLGGTKQLFKSQMKCCSKCYDQLESSVLQCHILDFCFPCAPPVIYSVTSSQFETRLAGKRLKDTDLMEAGRIIALGLNNSQGLGAAMGCLGAGYPHWAPLPCTPNHLEARPLPSE